MICVHMQTSLGPLGTTPRTAPVLRIEEMKPDLYTQPVSLDAVRKFINDIVELAISDHALKHPKRSGIELTDEFTSACCHGHIRMASSLYNKVRWTLDHRYID